MDQKDEIKSKSDIVSIIGERVELKKAGRNFKGLCPFHNEKTSSFTVSPELQIYKCFGCGRSGDVFSFLEEYEGMDFPESLKYLADRLGIKLKTFNTEKGIKDYLLEINLATMKFYNFILTKHSLGKYALNYLTKDRGISLKTIEEFNLGFSPDDSTMLNKFLIGKKKFNIVHIEKSGLGFRKGNFIADRFRGRVIFPLFDHRGNVLGFAGRIMPNVKIDVAKYINSPETDVYHKGSVLFGLNLSREFIKRKKIAIVVEGELDLISSWQIGIKNVVAIKGSALTEDQVKLLNRFADKVILALDADFAGTEAAKRGIKVAQEEGLEIRVATLKNYKDPDEAARSAPEEYKKALIGSVDIWDFLIDSVFKKYKSTDTLNISREVVPILSGIEDRIVRAQFIGKVANKLRVSENAVEEQVNLSKNNANNNPSKGIIIPEKLGKDRRTLIEERFLSLALKLKPEVLLKKDMNVLITTPFARKVLVEYEKFVSLGEEFNISNFSNFLPSEISIGFSEMILSDSEDEYSSLDDEKEFESIQIKLVTMGIKETLDGLEKKMKELEGKDEQIELDNAQKEFSELVKRLSVLEDEAK